MVENTDNLQEFWIVALIHNEAETLVTESEARLILAAQQAGGSSPRMFEVRDLYGQIHFIRTDRIEEIRQSTPEGRDLDRKHAVLLNAEKPFEN